MLADLNFPLHFTLAMTQDMKKLCTTCHPRPPSYPITLAPLQQNNVTINHRCRLLGGSSGGPDVLIGGGGGASAAPNTSSLLHCNNLQQISSVEVWALELRPWRREKMQLHPANETSSSRQMRKPCIISCRLPVFLGRKLTALGWIMRWYLFQGVVPE